MPSQIQAYQINLLSLSGYIQQVASSSGVGVNYYPANSNPSGYITTGQTGQFQAAGNYVTISQTGQFYSSSNPSGFVTGQYYPSGSNPSGYLTGFNSGIYIQTGQTGQFYNSNNPSGFITGINTGYYTGIFYSNNNPSGFIPSGNISGQSGIVISSSGNYLFITNTGGAGGFGSVGPNSSGYLYSSGSILDFVNPVNGEGGFSTISGTFYIPTGLSPNININLKLGNYYYITLTGASGTPTISFTGVSAGSNCIIEVLQNSSGLNCSFPVGTIQAGGGGNTYTSSGPNNTDLIAVIFKDSTHARISVTTGYN